MLNIQQLDHNIYLGTLNLRIKPDGIKTKKTNGASYLTYLFES